jgi:hypothetical protein
VVRASFFRFFAELVDDGATTGSFKFDQQGPVSFTKTRGNRAKSDEVLSLSRNGALNDVWDTVFESCSVLLSNSIPDSFTVQAGNAEIAKSAADIRITFAEFIVADDTGRFSEMVLALVGTTDQPAGELGLPYFYEFDSYGIFGQSVSGGPGGKKKCQKANQSLPAASFMDVTSQ